MLLRSMYTCACITTGYLTRQAVKTAQFFTMQHHTWCPAVTDVLRKHCVAAGLQSKRRTKIQLTNSMLELMKDQGRNFFATTECDGAKGYAGAALGAMCLQH